MLIVRLPAKGQPLCGLSQHVIRQRRVHAVDYVGADHPLLDDGATVRTVQLHIRELDDAGLLTRARHRHRASVPYIEDVSRVEIERYSAESDTSMTFKTGAQSTLPSRNDKSVASAEPAQTTKSALAYREEKK